ncbi:MAG: DNA repair protein RecO [Candidatus Beckwithbacteria bacterium]|nr:DNA repair protein RecO [Candidatus Beckwithbacteria bacterium]
MIKTYKTYGLVLRQNNFGEADRLLTIFTKDHGKLRLLAKSVRKPSSRKRGHLELFSHAKIVCARGKNLDLITEADTIDNFSCLRQNLNRVRIAYLLCELVNDLTAENQEHEDVYNLLLFYLTQLNSTVAPKNLILNFEKSLLELLGFGLPAGASAKAGHQAIENYISSITEKPINSKKIR